MTLQFRSLLAALFVTSLCGPVHLWAQSAKSCGPTFDTAVVVFDEGSGRPVRTIGGPRACLGLPQEVAVARSGELYVLSLFDSAPGKTVSPVIAVSVFGPDAVGNAPPLRQFSGSSR